jgi:hypothetical protein
MEISSQAGRIPNWEILLNTPSRTNRAVGNVDNRLQNKQRLLIKDLTLILTLLILAHRSQVCFMSAAEQRRTMIKCRKNV